MKEKLITSLKTVINALQNGIADYNWVRPEQCNCGLVVQAILGETSQQIQQRFIEVRKKLRSKGINDPTWKNGVKYLCPISAKTDVEIYEVLEKNGLSKEDIAHLEYLENPAILKESKIDVKAVWSIEEYENVEVKTFFGKKTEKQKVKRQVGYWTAPQNLLLYLKAWVRILEREIPQKEIKKMQPNELHEKLLNAVAEEKYELAAQLRNELALK